MGAEAGRGQVDRYWHTLLDRADQLCGEGADRVSHRLVDLLGLATVREVDQQHEAGGALDEGPDRGGVVLASASYRCCEFWTRSSGWLKTNCGRGL